MVEEIQPTPDSAMSGFRIELPDADSNGEIIDIAEQHDDDFEAKSPERSRNASLSHRQLTEKLDKLDESTFGGTAADTGEVTRLKRLLQNRMRVME